MLSPPVSDAVTIDYLVEDEQRAVARRYLAETFQEPGLRWDDAHVAGDRLGDDTGYLVWIRREVGFDRVEVVELRDQRVLREGGGDAGAVGHAVGHGAGARSHQQRVGVPVVAALELDDLVSVRESPRQPQSAHRRLGAGAHEPHQVHGVEGV